MFDLFFLDYFITFRVVFRLIDHGEFTSKSGDQQLLRTSVDKYSED